MRTSSSELKRRARQALKGNYGLCVGAQCILFGIVLVIVAIYIGIAISLELIKSMGTGYHSIIPFLEVGGVIGYLALLPLYNLLGVGLLKLYLNLSTGQPASLSNLLFSFKNRPWRFVGLYFINIGIEFLWGIPCIVVFAVAIVTNLPMMVILAVLMYFLWIIGALITMLYLAQTVFILIDNPEKGVFKSIKESAGMMKGHKGRLFYLYISFIGIFLLGYASAGIGFLWALPYIQCTQVQFYLDLKAEQEPAYVEEDSFKSVWNEEQQQL